MLISIGGLFNRDRNNFIHIFKQKYFKFQLESYSYPGTHSVSYLYMSRILHRPIGKLTFCLITCHIDGVNLALCVRNKQHLGTSATFLFSVAFLQK